MSGVYYQQLSGKHNPKINLLWFEPNSFYQYKYTLENTVQTILVHHTVFSQQSEQILPQNFHFF
jgi:hypothetical protein